MVMIAADTVHLTAGAWWLSGVLVFATALARSPSTRMPAIDLTAALARFSSVATIGAVAVGLTGSIMVVIVVDDASDILGTGWGRTVLVKLLVVAAIAFIGRWNARGLEQLVKQAGTEARRWEALRTAMMTESALLLVVVLITGFLTQMSPG